jgi:cytoskeletal protein CcmA (bactofilin family)
MSHTPNALLGKGSQFEGKLTFEGTVHIDGRFTGEIFSEGTLIIGEGAEIQAEIRVATVEVYGNVTGNITATESVALRAPASLRGNIASPALNIDHGVFFDGTCQMTTKSSGAQRPTGPVPSIRPAPMTMQSPSVRESQPMPSQMSQNLPPQLPQQRPSGVYLPETTPARTTGELKHNF